MHHIQERDPRFDDPFLSGFRVRFHQYTQTTSNKNIYSYIFIMIQPFYRFFTFIIALLLAPSAFALPNGFIDEAVGRMQGTSGTFVPNPRQNGKPMMLVVSIEGLIFAIEDPDNAGPRLQIADMRPIICNNGPHGILNIEPHPDFATNRFIFLYYTRIVPNCPEDPILGPSHRLSRFTIDATTLQLIVNSEVVLLETPPAKIALHAGGAMVIGNDRLIYLVIGDGGDLRQAQDLRNLFGKLVRLDLNGNVPAANPYTIASGGKGVNCRDNKGRPPVGAALDAVCEESFSYGFRNPFRMGIDMNTNNKVRFSIGDVGNANWEELSYGGTDFKGSNYGWAKFEGPCIINSLTDCPPPGIGFTDPYYYYIHSPNGGAVTGSVFVPNGLWPARYKNLFIEFIEGTILNLVPDNTVGCRTCTPPRPSFRNETFQVGDRMVDLFFGPYKDTQALYYVTRGAGDNIRRIRYIGGLGTPPTAVITVSKNTYLLNEAIIIDGTQSSDADGDALEYQWDFGDGRTSTVAKPNLSYSRLGTFEIKLTVTDTVGLTSVAFQTVIIGTPPVVIIETPKAGADFQVGEIFRIKGNAKDSSGLALPAKQLFWEVRLRHGGHFHPFLPMRSGSNFDLPPAPNPEDFMAARTSYLVLVVTATDSNGLSTTIRRNIQPKKVQIDMRTNPQGLKVLVGDFIVVTPATIIAWQNQNLKIEAEDQGEFVFQSWNIKGPRQRTYLVPPLNTTANPKIIARFQSIG